MAEVGVRPWSWWRCHAATGESGGTCVGRAAGAGQEEACAYLCNSLLVRERYTGILLLIIGRAWKLIVFAGKGRCLS
jgi:hypothetical protein